MNKRFKPVAVVMVAGAVSCGAGTTYAGAGADALAVELADSGRCFGPLKDGRMQGVGCMEWCNGEVYSGGFGDGLMYGQGRMRYRTGVVYQGDFEDGVPSGIWDR